MRAHFTSVSDVTGEKKKNKKCPPAFALPPAALFPHNAPAMPLFSSVWVGAFTIENRFFGSVVNLQHFHAYIRAAVCRQAVRQTASGRWTETEISFLAQRKENTVSLSSSGEEAPSSEEGKKGEEKETEGGMKGRRERERGRERERL